ncbi:MAG: lactate racemase domain-containing protein [Planctomycetaceae bacterium]
MSDASQKTFTVSYGSEQVLEFSLPADRVIWQHYAPEALQNPQQAIHDALAVPVEFPPLSQAVIPDDRVTIAAEADTPCLGLIIAQLWAVLSEQGVKADNITVVQAAGSKDPRIELPDDVREKINWVQHDASDKNAVAYLASTTSGDRIQLARAVTDAEVVVSVGRIGFDPILGYRGTNSVFYPMLSTADAIAKTRGQGHAELEPDDSRPLRQAVDEIGWLLGTQFTVQAIPALNGGIAQVLAGAFEPVLRRGKEFVSRELMVTPDQRPELVVASVTTDAGGDGWNQIASAIAAASRLVARDGKILILSQSKAELDQGMEILRQVETPADAIKPLRLEAPVDLMPATQIANAVQHASVYLLSEFNSDLIDELFIFPLTETGEAVRLIEQSEGPVAIIEDAHNVHSRIAE